MDDKPANGRSGGWKQDPAGVRKNILAVAMAEFAANGLSGARIDEIAAKTSTSKRMIYYYFGDKEGLYRRVLEEAYREVRAGEQELELDHVPPVEALKLLAEFTFDHHSRHPDFIRLVMIENIHHGAYLERSELIRPLNAGAVQKLETICRRGREVGVFREDVTPLQLHWHISAMSFFNVSNRTSFSHIFGTDLFSAGGQEALKKQMVEMVVGLALKPQRRSRGSAESRRHFRGDTK
jgi:AcrR family transcriptional regulator